jgi:signal transduction histidine kinase
MRFSTRAATAAMSARVGKPLELEPFTSLEASPSSGELRQQRRERPLHGSPSAPGRGVGMDAVESTVRSLGGMVLVESEPGVGTEFRFALPVGPAPA